MIKVAAPNMALKIIDDAIQAFGGPASLDESGLAKAYSSVARCASRTALMKSTIVPLHAWSCANTPTRHFDSERARWR